MRVSALYSPGHWPVVNADRGVNGNALVNGLPTEKAKTKIY